MLPDLEKYRPYLSRFDLTGAEKDEYILALWTMLERIVDRAWGVHPVQQVAGERTKENACRKQQR